MTLKILSHSTKPLSEPMLSEHQWDPMAFNCIKFHSECFRNQSVKYMCIFENYTLKITATYPRDQRVVQKNHQPYDCLLNHLFSADQRKHQSSASLAFVWGIHRWPVNSLHKWPVRQKMFPFDDVSIISLTCLQVTFSNSRFHVELTLNTCIAEKHPKDAANWKLSGCLTASRRARGLPNNLGSAPSSLMVAWIT